MNSIQKIRGESYIKVCWLFVEEKSKQELGISFFIVICVGLKVVELIYFTLKV